METSAKDGINTRELFFNYAIILYEHSNKKKYWFLNF